MDVFHFLAGVGALVHDEPVPAESYFMPSGHLLSDDEHVPHDGHLAGAYVSQPSEAFQGDNQQMHRGLWVYVLYDKDPLVAVDDLCINFTPRNLAEDAVFGRHGLEPQLRGHKLSVVLGVPKGQLGHTGTPGEELEVVLHCEPYGSVALVGQGAYFAVRLVYPRLGH